MTDNRHTDDSLADGGYYGQQEEDDQSPPPDPYLQYHPYSTTPTPYGQHLSPPQSPNQYNQPSPRAASPAYLSELLSSPGPHALRQTEHLAHDRPGYIDNKRPDQSNSRRDSVRWPPSKAAYPAPQPVPRHSAVSQQDTSVRDPWGGRSTQGIKYKNKSPVSQNLESLIQQLKIDPLGIPQTEAEAQRHIKTIRDEKRENYRSGNAKDLEGALDILSNELYQKPMHFLLELLQNADDNVYKDSTTPIMKITYWNGTLRFDTNEIGFSRADVEAICSIAHSLKNESQREGRRIGEKGIGFKAVFRVADEVFINSGHYSFKFTDKEALGRLAPVWAGFPEERLTGFTSILLRLRQQVDHWMLVREMKKLDARLLMFLQRLKEVEISVFETQFRNMKFTLRREDLTSEYSGLQLRILKPDNNSPYIIFRYPVSHLPKEEKRRNCNKSEIVLAFPNIVALPPGQQQKEQKAVSQETHKVYSFLPIRDYGFKFVFQADFVLVANREEIRYTSEWNKALRNHIPSALLKAITKFNNSNFRYYWPHFFPVRVERDDFFQGLSWNTKILLSEKAILESTGGNLVLPSALVLVPMEFTDTNRQPLIPPGCSKFTYVSPKYPIEISDALKSLGVKCLLVKDFLDDLSNFITNHSDEFQRMSKEWHSRLSKVLDSLTAKHQQLISSLRFIPLRNGTWIAPQAGPLLLPLVSNDLVIPDKIGRFIVHLDAASDHTRKTLLRKLGAQDSNKPEVCRTIIQTHGSKEFDPKTVSRTDLIHHAAFLYGAGWKRQQPTENLWMVPEDESRRLSPEIYLDSQDHNSASQVLRKHRARFAFLHREYSKIFHTQDHQEWLLENLMLSIVPRLASPDDSPGTFELNDDFRFLINNIPALEVLQLLRTHWTFYRTWIAPEETQVLKGRIGAPFKSPSGTRGRAYLGSFGELDVEKVAKERSYDRMKALFSSMTVQCRDGFSAQLDQTYLPRKDVLEALDIPKSARTSASAESTLRVLLVREPDATDWDFLENFGVIVKVEAEQLIRHLEKVKETGTTKEQVALLYERIEACAKDENIGLIKREFQEKILVFIPARTTRWVRLKDCVWDGPACLAKIPRLRDYHPQREALFCDKLSLVSATLRTVVAEAKQITSSDSLGYIRDVLKQLNRMIYGTFNSTQYSDEFYDLKNYPIFPVWTGKSHSNFDCLGTAGTITISNEWYIADLPYLRDSFEGEAPLLAFEASNSDDIKFLITRMGCDGRRLSRLAKKEPALVGGRTLNKEYTRSLRQKWRCISRLIPPWKPDTTTLTKQLRHVQVFQPQRLSVVWKFYTSWGTTISGRSEEGRVIFIRQTDRLIIYLADDYMEIGRPPGELTEELKTFCGIKDEHILLLVDILMQKNIKKIEENLNRWGMPDKVAQFTEADSVSASDTEEDLQATDTPRNLVHKNEAKHPIQRTSPGMETYRSDTTYDQDPRVRGFVPYSNPKAEWGHIPSSQSIRRPRQKDSDRGLVWSVPVPSMRDDNQDEENWFIAELYVNDFLGSVLRDEYIPHRHWTSNMRSRAGHKPYNSQDSSVSTFTIQDTSGRLKGFLARQGYRQVESLTTSPAFHIQVVVSGGPVNSTFEMDSDQIRKAKRLSFLNTSEQTHAAIFVLAFVFNLHIDPAIALFADPWQLHRNHFLSLEARSEHEGRFNEKAPVLYVHRGKNPTSACESGWGQEVFEYQGLKPGDIRVLELISGKDDEPIRGTIRHVSIDNPGTFWAISYVWGTPTKNRSGIYIEIQERKIPLTLSLYSAIKALRDKKTTVPFWADAVCINQADSREKALQIRLMGKVFQKAERVVAWLGEEYERSHEAMETLSQVRLRSQTLAYSSRDDGPTTTTRSWSGRVPDPTDSIWKDINSLVKRQWFKRVWIAQELVLPSKVVLICGRQSELDWDHFFEALTICEREINAGYRVDPDNIRLLPDAGPAYALGLTRRKSKNKIKFSLLELLELFFHTQASIEADRLFALLGLAYDAISPQFNPDYDSTLQQVVQRYAEGFVLQGHAIDLLYQAGISKSYPFCSWIPRWTRGHLPETISTWDAAGGEFYAGSQYPPFAMVKKRTPKCLFVKGYVVDTIWSTDQICIGTGGSLYLNDSMSSFRKLLRHITNYPTGETGDDLLLKLPIGDARRPHLESATERLRSYRDSGAWKTENWPTDLRQLILSIGHDKEKMPCENQKTVVKYLQTAAAFSSRLSNSFFCFTEKRYVGLVPPAAAKGDQVCLLHGGRVPFALRQQGPGYTLIGECYIHGIMHGEALHPKLEEKTFMLL